MFTLLINKDKTIVQNTKTNGQWTIKTTSFFGVVYASLERNFPNFDCSQFGNVIAAHVCNKLAGQTEKKTNYLFHCEEIGTSLFNLLMFIDEKLKLINGRRVLAPTLQDIEELRIFHGMTINYLPISIEDKDSMRFTHLQSVTQVMIAALYYYAYNEYKLTPCKHCGKWFATKTLKEEYCDSISPCYGMIIEEKTVLGSERTCKDAVGIIKQRLADRKKQIYNKWYAEGFDDECKELTERYSQFSKAIKECPTVENIAACMKYLYSDAMPKQERPNRRKSNAERRRLLGT